MGISTEKAALLIIDMQNGYIKKDAPLCIAGAEATLPQCAQALTRARELAIPVFYVRREYAGDGSDIEPARFEVWLKAGKPISKASSQSDSLNFPEMIQPQPDDFIVTKPRYSSFFKTGLDEELRARSLNTVIIIGTTTPNCVRATCTDALSLCYNVVIIEDCTSSRTPEVQAANIADMFLMGVQVISTEEFLESGLEKTRDLVSEYQQALSIGL